MDAIDIFLIIILAGGAIIGYRRGLVVQLGSIFGFVGAVIACRLFASAIVKLVGAESATAIAMAYVATFVLGYLAVYLASRTVNSMLHSIKLGMVDHVAGAAFKVLQYAVVLSIFAQIWLAILPSEREEICSKSWRESIVNLAPKLIEMRTAALAAEQEQADGQDAQTDDAV